MYNWEETRDLVNEFIDKLEFEREPRELYAPIRYTLSQSGKRVRPVLFIMAYNMYKECVDEALYPAVAMETYHNYTLIHDDVMDRADIRRGKPTVCAKWGDTAAILSGDTMFVLAYEFLSHVPADKLPAMLALFTETAKEIGDGQQYDLGFEQRDDVAEQEYMEMIRLKTAVLLAGAVKIGALIGGASDTDTEALYNFAIKLGLAFQLQDDLLDTYGDEKTFGKAIGGDIMENKKTFLLISAMENAQPDQLNAIQAWINEENPVREEKVEAIRNIYDEIGVKYMAEEKINELFAQALQIVREMNIGAEGKLFFTEFANKLLKRNK